jgi:hypothetical protein
MEGNGKMTQRKATALKCQSQGMLTPTCMSDAAVSITLECQDAHSSTSLFCTGHATRLRQRLQRGASVCGVCGARHRIVLEEAVG